MFVRNSIAILIINCCVNTLASQVIQTRPIEPHIITFFVQPYQEQAIRPREKVQIITETPGKLNRTILKKQLQSTRNQGLYATYFGLVTHSDANGQITFPRKHFKNEVTFVITQRIKPVMLYGNTVHHFDMSTSMPADFYRLELKEDVSKKIFYWDTKKIDAPTNRHVPVSAIILFAKPEHVIIYQGKTVTDASENFVLPTVYVKPTITTGINALSFLKISKYFRPVKFVYNYTPERYATMIKP